MSAEQHAMVLYQGGLDRNIKTVIVLVLDGSGSMERLKEETQKALNDYMKAGREVPHADTAVCSIVIFSDRAEVLMRPVKLSATQDVTEYRPKGGTRLYGTLVDVLQPLVLLAREAKQEDRDMAFILAAFTDGEDTNSKDALPELHRLMGEAKEIGNFNLSLYGIGVDGKAHAKNMGFPHDNAHTVARDQSGVSEASTILSRETYRTVVSQVERK